MRCGPPRPRRRPRGGYLAEEHPEIGVRAPQPGGVPVSLVLTVADVDDVVGPAVAAGARLDRGPYEGSGIATPR